MSNSVPSKTKNNLVRFELKCKSDNSSEQLLTEYLNRHSIVSPQARIGKAVESFYLPLSVSPDHEHFRSIVLESLVSLQAQIDLIENLTGISVKHSGLEVSEPITIYPPNSIPPLETTKTRPHKLAVRGEESNPTAESNVMVTPIKPDPVLSPLEELGAKIMGLLQELANGEDGLEIIRILNELQPKNEEDWSDEMWEIYDRAREQVSEANYQVTFNIED